MVQLPTGRVICLHSPFWGIFMESIPKAGVIKWQPDECLGCSRCFTACAVYHHSAVAPPLSGIIWHDEQQLCGFQLRRPLFCKHCAGPECYLACPLKDKAMCIDSATGARYINIKECIGCGLCIEACPFDEPRINLADIDGRQVAIKCDLCKERAGGPVCVEVCSRQALTLVTRKERL